MSGLIISAPSWWDSVGWFKWHQQNQAIGIPIVAFYLIVIYVTNLWMKTRKPMSLKSPLIIWNTLLAIFSILGAIHSAHNCFWTVKKLGLGDGLCDNSFLYEPDTLLWGWLFAWSKVIEFGDTLFIVLRRKPLTFLHVYHHSITCFTCLYYFASGTAIARWACTINYIVHSFMYSYFALSGAGYLIPRPFAQALTLAQLCQMFIGIFINSFYIYRLKNGLPCHSTVNLSSFNMAMYLTYAILFAHLYVQKYLTKSRKSQ